MPVLIDDLGTWKPLGIIIPALYPSWNRFPVSSGGTLVRVYFDNIPVLLHTRCYLRIVYARAIEEVRSNQWIRIFPESNDSKKIIELSVYQPFLGEIELWLEATQKHRYWKNGYNEADSYSVIAEEFIPYPEEL